MTRFVQPERIEIDANERAVNEKSQYCFFVCTTFDSFLNDYAGDFAKVKDGMMHISESLQGMIENIINSSAQVSAGADDLSRAAQNIAEGASTQAASVEELVATSVSVSEQVKENTDDALKSADETARVTKMMQDSRTQMDQMTEAMNKITETSNEVVSIIKTIEDIADQTNLLALNASIEAARAGEAGKGFAVVASEIQKLSSQSDSTASKIQEIITDLQNDSKETLEVMRSTEVLVREQYEKLAATKERFKEVGNGINVSKHGTDVIKGNAEVCDSSRVTVVDVISNLSAISEENAASTQQTTSSMQELNATINILAETAAKVKEVSDQLNEDMKYFKM